MSQNYLSDEEYDYIYSRSPRICVDLLVRNSKGEVLLTKRTIEPYINYWHFPGGRVKFRETIHHAVTRIALTELGISLEDAGTVVGVCEFLEEYQKHQPRHSISIVHEITLSEGAKLKAQDKYSWFNSMPEPVIPPQKEFLTEKGILK